MEEIRVDTLIAVQTGDNFDLELVQIVKHAPSSTSFLVLEWRKPGVQKTMKVLYCQHDFCGKVFKNWHNFFDHLRTHTNERPYTCEVCRLTFNQEANLKKHVTVHTDTKKFCCIYCLKKFRTKYNYNVRKQPWNSLLTLFTGPFEHASEDPEIGCLATVARGQRLSSITSTRQLYPHLTPQLCEIS